MHAEIVVLPGDGIGPEVAAAAVAVLKAVAGRFNHTFTFSEHDIGGIAIDRHGEPLPASTLTACQAANAVLLGAVGGPKWSDPNAKVRPEQGLLAIRKALGLYANLRPVRTHEAALHASPIKAELLQGVDFVVVRELTGGIYFGDKTRDADSASDLCRYSVTEIERVLTQFGGAFGGAAGPIRAVAARTCDLMPVAARVAEILHPTLDLGDRVRRLAIRLTYGVPSAAVDLAQFAGADLLRGDYCRLAAAQLCEPEQIDAATDDQILACVDKDRRKLALVRDAAKRVAKRRAEAVAPSAPILEVYVP